MSAELGTGTRHGAADIARALGQPPPTDQQRVVIEAPLSPLLVVAGAGSGKTETMASRVVWLVANGHVAPDQVLGLTFTRKAATELSERITRRLNRLQQSGLWTPAVDDGSGAETLGGTPTISTYHSYAGRLVREHALRLGYESESRLLSEAAAWQFAAEVVAAYDGRMDDVPQAESTIVAHVVDLAGELAEHLLMPEDVSSYLARVEERLAGLPRGSSRAKALPKETTAMRTALRARAGVLPMVERYLQLKRDRDAMDFSDQMALAARLAGRFDDIGAVERMRFRAVLLDEFQDTSDAQLQLLRSVFWAAADPLPVTAVGDPNQSIYGWRGASATTLDAFRRAFGGGDLTPQSPLSTSWRNDDAILAVANAVAEPLRATALVEVEELVARPAAGPGEVRAARVSTLEDEAALVAEWVQERRGELVETDQGARPMSCAVLCRKRSQFAAVMDALEAREIPYEVVGLGGLLLTPEVEDVVALLHVVQDPTRGDQLMRLLTGPACRLGAADLDGLMAWATHQQEVRAARAGVVPADQAPDSVDRASLVEALDDLPPADWRTQRGQCVSEVALERLAGLRRVVQRLRSLAALPLADLAGEAERALGLDIEVLSRPGYTPAAARAHLDAFADVAAGFTASADRPSLGGFLSWLTAAMKEERGLDKGYIEASTDAVQVLTIHAAKGLEWDAVAVPGLVEATFPNLNYAVSKHDGAEWVMSPEKDRGWVAGFKDGGVPYALRGDRAGLPQLDWEAAADLADLERRVGEFHLAGGAHGIAEERRLAYVAFTRARRSMLLSAAVWADATTPRVTSRFFSEVLAKAPGSVRVLEWAEMPDPDLPETLVNPRTADPEPVLWPADPLRERRRALASGAERVRAAIAAAGSEVGGAGVGGAGVGGTGVGGAGGSGGVEGGAAEEVSGGAGAGPGIQAALPLPGHDVPVLEELEMLLRERAAHRTRGPAVVEMPRHLSTSAMVALAQDAAAFATDLRRPMPHEPALAARRGTAFHAWIEQHFARAAMVDLLDLPGSADEDPAEDEELPAMKERFLASEWASRVPLEIEISLETILDGVAIRGRIDAVFPDGDSSGGFFSDAPSSGPVTGSAVESSAGVVVVDWKTGRPPHGDLSRVRALQLSAYRLAYARLRGIPLEQVRAAFYYAATGHTVWPELVGEEGLRDVLAAVPE